MSPKARRLTDLLDPTFMSRLDSLDVLSRKILQGKLLDIRSQFFKFVRSYALLKFHGEEPQFALEFTS